MVPASKAHRATRLGPDTRAILLRTSRPSCPICLARTPPHSSRPYSSTHTRSAGHYKTLGVQQDATKSQIKSSFYKLSKLYHPDVTQDPSSKEKFQAASEAYAVLGDDRRRRAYDKSLATIRTTHDPHRPSSSAYHNPYDTIHRRGATHAWSHPRPSTHSHGKTSGFARKPGFESSHPQSGHHYDPFSSPNVWRATGRHTTGSKKTATDHVTAESSVWRAMQVIGVILIVVTVGGGFHVST